MDVLDLLKQDHKRVAGLIDAVEKADPGDESLTDLAQQIANELTIHSTLEEQMFYPILRDRAEEEEERVDVFEAFTEHDVVKHLLSLLERRRTNPELFKAELQVLGENVKHHVREEETTIFSLARELMDDDERDALGEQVQEQKEQMMRSGSRGRKKSTQSGNGRKKGARTPAAGKRANGKATSRNGTTRKGTTRKTTRR